jgi:hypothetical protein
LLLLLLLQRRRLWSAHEQPFQQPNLLLLLLQLHDCCLRPGRPYPAQPAHQPLPCTSPLLTFVLLVQPLPLLLQVQQLPQLLWAAPLHLCCAELCGCAWHVAPRLHQQVGSAARCSGSDGRQHPPQSAQLGRQAWLSLLQAVLLPPLLLVAGVLLLLLLLVVQTLQQQLLLPLLLLILQQLR